MTRINVVPVEELTDNFLIAEYWEIPRIFPLVHNHIQANREPKDLDIPDTYRMGTGHIKFFYDKLDWIFERLEQLEIEGLKRKLSIKMDPVFNQIDLSVCIHSKFWNKWNPIPQEFEAALQANRDRLQYRRRYEGRSYASSN